MTNNNYGKFLNDKGCYSLSKIPEAGNFEFIYNNKNLFIKLDQYGPSLCQFEPPVDLKILLRKERERFSPWLTYFSINGKVTNNFDIYTAKSFNIIYKPEKAIYTLHFKKLDVITEVLIDANLPEVQMIVTFVNLSDKPMQIKTLSVATLEMVDSIMAAWDKREWYTTTKYDGSTINPYFSVTHLSVNGNKDERRYVNVLFTGNSSSCEISYEKLVSFTKNFSTLGKKLSLTREQEMYSYEQTCASIFELNVIKEEKLVSVININKDDFKAKNDILSHTTNSYHNSIYKEILSSYDNRINVQSVSTLNNDFNKFVNEFLPSEISWVINLDRGWPTGMRGTRDCANDFMGFIPYDKASCKSVIEKLFSSQRYSDGWFPRQIPFGNSNKYDMREFVDSACFVIEFIYEYLSYTNDYSILDNDYSYLDNEIKESGLTHLRKALQFYFLESNLGEHGLIKLKGGDWLDCLNRVGLKGRGETVMVTAQVILAIQQINEILSKYDGFDDEISLNNKYAALFKKNINQHCLEDEGFYKALFSDDGKWYFSKCDIDGKKRIYTPTNSYAIIADINPKINKKIIASIVKNNKDEKGYRLFSIPFGCPEFEGLGKMSSGDFLPNALENAAIYNHGAQLFFLRALAKEGDYKTFTNVLNYALPFNPKYHNEKESCLPQYAVTNVYNLAPYFEGRGGMSFLTGSISMISRAIYHWMFGIDFHIDSLHIKPCLPKEYKDSSVKLKYNEHLIIINYIGYGAKVKKMIVNNKEINVISDTGIIDKSDINCDLVISVELENK